MRTITYNAGAYLVEELQRAGIVARWLHDGGDILLFETRARQQVSIHLIESSIELYEIKNTLADNAARGIFTLFILWGDRLLPSDGHAVRHADWMEALYKLYGDRIYAYDIYGSEIFVFPVHFDRAEQGRRARYGTTVHMRHLGCVDVDLRLAGISGHWRVAGFDLSGAESARVVSDDYAPLLVYYRRLGVQPGDDPDLIKKAYRLLARRYHPDLNDAPDAHERMQQINEAYERLMNFQPPT
jgi:hypothetical protein